MQIRLGTVLSTLAMAFLIYAGMVTIVIHRIDLMLQSGCSMQGTSPPQPAEDHSIAFFVAVNVCALWLAAQIIFYIRRRSNRRREGFCHECGRPLEISVLRCPICGEKRCLFGSTEVLFPVIFSDEKEQSINRPPVVRIKRKRHSRFSLTGKLKAVFLDAAPIRR